MSRDCPWKPESIRVVAGEGRPPIDNFGYLQVHQNCENGVICETAHSEDAASEDETFLGGAFSQTISLSPEVHTSIQPLASMQLVNQNSNLYHSTMSKIKRVLETCQRYNDPELERFLITELNAVIDRFYEFVFQKYGNKRNFTGECVSMSVPIPMDRRKKFKRSEPVRKTNDLDKGERTAVQLSRECLITTDEKQPCVESRSIF